MELNPVELRILGCLVEKESTTPDNYPLSSNALVNACNQTSNRDPVVQYDERTIDAALLELRPAGLARTVTGGRANKHRHVLDEAWGLASGELAVLAVLFLRGPQTAGELRTRTERMHEFGSLSAVEAVLVELAQRSEPFVNQLERQPGQKEARWVQVVGAMAEAAEITKATSASSASPAVVSGPTAGQAPDDMQAELRRLRADVDRLYELLGEPAPGGG